jgi:galactokinase
MNTLERKTWIVKEFEQLYGAEPTIWTRAPGRVDLMGSHTDYNEGFILTMTIDRDAWIAARPRGDDVIRIHSFNLGEGDRFSLGAIEHNRRAPWINYVSGVAKILQEAGFALCGFDGLLHTTVPLGGGLSSSAALEMATARLLERISGLTIDGVTLARLAQRAENEFVGVNCGILDQYTSSVGRAGCALLLDARHLTSRDVPIAAGLQVVICDTRAERTLSGTEYGERRAQCEEGVRLIRTVAPDVTALRDVTEDRFDVYAPLLPTLTARRCRFIVEENARVLAMEEALSTGNAGQLNRLFAASYAGAHDLYELCIPAMDAMMTSMRSAPGFIAGRQAGAGFGGCMVALIDATQTDHFASHVQQRYRQATGVEPHIYVVSPAEGAAVLERSEQHDFYTR